MCSMLMCAFFNFTYIYDQNLYLCMETGQIRWIWNIYFLSEELDLTNQALKDGIFS